MSDNSNMGNKNSTITKMLVNAMIDHGISKLASVLPEDLTLPIEISRKELKYFSLLYDMALINKTTVNSSSDKTYLTQTYQYVDQYQYSYGNDVSLSDAAKSLPENSTTVLLIIHDGDDDKTLVYVLVPLLSLFGVLLVIVSVILGVICLRKSKS